MRDVLPVAEAKKNFTALIRESSEALKVFRVANAQRRQSPRSLILGEAAMEVLLERLTCSPRWEEDPAQRLWSVHVPELDVFGQGATRDEAADDLIEAAVEYSEVYLEDVPFYFKAGRKDHYPYVLAVLLAAGDRDKLRRVIGV